MEIYSDWSDVKRAIVNTSVINSEFILHYSRTTYPKYQAEVFKALLVSSSRSSIRFCINIEAKYTEFMISLLKVISLFDAVVFVRNALLHYLGAIVPNVNVSEVLSSSIHVGLELSQFNNAEKVTQKSSCYVP